MKKFELIRWIFDYVMAHGEFYSHSDAISDGCTRDGLTNRVFGKKVQMNLPLDDYGLRIDNVSITCLNENMSDATDADVRITFLGAFGTARKVIYANEAIEKTLRIIYAALNK